MTTHVTVLSFILAGRDGTNFSLAEGKIKDLRFLSFYSIFRTKKKKQHSSFYETFRRVRNEVPKMRLLISSCLSICPHVTTLESLKEFP
jgi:hypothetical protein